VIAGVVNFGFDLRVLDAFRLLTHISPKQLLIAKIVIGFIASIVIIIPPIWYLAYFPALDYIFWGSIFTLGVIVTVFDFGKIIYLLRVIYLDTLKNFNGKQTEKTTGKMLYL
jgi:uncharacterized membrane protein